MNNKSSLQDDVTRWHHEGHDSQLFKMKPDKLPKKVRFNLQCHAPNAGGRAFFIHNLCGRKDLFHLQPAAFSLVMRQRATNGKELVGSSRFLEITRSPFPPFAGTGLARVKVFRVQQKPHE
jgi:hypothetical protein